MSLDAASGAVVAIVCAAVGALLSILPLMLFEKRRHDRELVKICTMLAVECRRILQYCKHIAALELNQEINVHMPVLMSVWLAVNANGDFIEAVREEEYHVIATAYNNASVLEIFRQRYDLFSTTQGPRSDFLRQIAFLNQDMNGSAQRAITAFEPAIEKLGAFHLRCVTIDRTSKRMLRLVVTLALVMLAIAAGVALSSLYLHRSGSAASITGFPQF